jgi:hypothetical protein
MLTSLPARTRQTGRAVSGIGRGLVMLGVISLVALCVLLAFYGPHTRTGAEAEEARLVEEENRAFCSKFGIGPETSRYAECAAGLTESERATFKEAPATPSSSPAPQSAPLPWK